MIYVILPAYNEEKAIGAVLAKIAEIASASQEPFRVVVVDDGSRDKTVETARAFSPRLDLKIFSFEQNRGVAEVFRQGFEFACENSKNPAQDIAIVLDSDNTQDPQVMKPMIQKIRAGEDLVIASRFEGEGKMIGCPWLRGLLSYGISWLLQSIVRLPNVKDYSTFYRAYRICLLQEGFQRYGSSLFDGKGFAVAAGLLIKLGNRTSRISEVPLVLRYDMKTGASGMKIFRTIKGYLLLIGQYLLSGGFKKARPAAAHPAS